MSRRIKSVRLVFIFVISMALLCFAPAGFAKKGGNGGGKPGSGDNPGCTGLENGTPTIVYLSAFEKTGGRDGYYFQDLYLSDSSGCNKYLIKAEAAKWLPDTKRNEGINRFIEDVTDLRLVVDGNRGVISWLDAYHDPWKLEYLEYFYDEHDGTFTFGSEGSYDSNIGYLIVEQDIRIQEDDHLLAALIEMDPNSSPAHRRIVVVNLTDPEKPEPVIVSSHDCHFVDPSDPDELCFGPRYGPLLWDPTGDAIYVAYEHTPETGNYLDYIIRFRPDSIDGWLEPEPEPIVTNVGTDPFQVDLYLAGVSLDGYISYGFRNPDGSGGASPHLRGIILEPDSCLNEGCKGDEGDYVFEGRAGRWTVENTIIFNENGNLLEYTDPRVSGETRTVIEGISEFDSDL